MDQKAFAEEVLRLAKARGVEAEVFARSADEMQVSVSKGALERYEVSKTGGLSLRVNVEGRSGYAYTERCEDAETLVTRAIDNARSIEGGDEHPMQGPQRYARVERERPPLLDMTHADRIGLALALESKALAEDPRVRRLVYCDVGTLAGSVMIRNSLGLEAERRSMAAYSYAMPLIEDGDEVQTGFGCRILGEAADVEGCAREAVENALEKLRAAPVPSGAYRVILSNLAMTDLLEAFTPIFSADEAQKGCSLLMGREGQRIGASCVTITDDPFHAIAPRAFDDEGTPCRKKHVVENGVLNTLLHNLKTAKKAGVSSTGNAYRASAASPLGAAPSVFYIAPGTESAQTLIERLGDGLIITELAGLHAGLSMISGDFSLQAHGKLVEHGKAVRAVGNITLAGNFLDLLQGVEAVGDDLRFSMPSGFYAASPSLLISALTVAGE